MSIRPLALALFLAFTAVHASATVGEDVQASDRAAEFARLADKEAGSYRFDIEGASDGFQLQTASKLNWTNPVSGSIRGRVFIWTHFERPCAIASIFKFDEEQRITSEFHSLMNQSFRVTRDDGAEWTPTADAVPEISISTTSVPGTALARSVRMRSIARSFSAERIDSDGSKTKLRLLSQPLLRYDAPKLGVIDGAVFALVQGTNPDVILVIEAFEDDAGLHWRYLTARMHRSRIVLRHQGSEIRDFPLVPREQLGNPSSAYSVLRRTL